MSLTEQMLTGAIAALSFVAGLLFLRFWRTTKDAFFLLFALSFWIEGCNRVALGLLAAADETAPFVYLVRVISYGLILVAIWQKNRRG
jgi:hypothetical protein